MFSEVFLYSSLDIQQSRSLTFSKKKSQIDRSWCGNVQLVQEIPKSSKCSKKAHTNSTNSAFFGKFHFKHMSSDYPTSELQLHIFRFHAGDASPPEIVKQQPPKIKNHIKKAVVAYLLSSFYKIAFFQNKIHPASVITGTVAI